MLGKRNRLRQRADGAHNVAFTVMRLAPGVGWFGFNAGLLKWPRWSRRMAMTVTQIAPLCGLAWMFTEWLTKVAELLGIASVPSRVCWQSPRPRASCCRMPRS